ncbi:MAG: alpha-L-glutamate ligase-like protein [Gammaproteobacteria bacterium RIFCSPLOWO2_12_FULL_52_10]|nr:MAG: alpha-L-glutamate ligase-like protein [Gammaproteobacteria bacterium RIFCSPLOWO2_12_FULL_52_10]
MLGLARKLRKAGVVGLNARNRGYIMHYNPRALYELVDDKVLTKRLAMQAQIAVPRLYGLIGTVHDAKFFQNMLTGINDFVIKPAHGSGGNGILVIARRKNDLFYKPDGVAIDAGEVRHHIVNILGGMYSLGGLPDQAIIEYRVHFDPIFNTLSYNGVPDIRMLVYRGVPTMAMLRLPTRQSDGRANLHQGAVGVGINLNTGQTTLGVYRNRRIFEHPDFDTRLSGWQIPGWEELLLLSARCYEFAPLGYLGVDLVLDARLGPLMLELNARPGLNIQIANGRGLAHRLRAVDAAITDTADAVQRVAISKTLT